VWRRESVVENGVKSLKLVVGLAAAAAVCLSGTAHAARVGVYIGPGYYWGPPVYYYPPPPTVVAVPVAPAQQEYIEQGQTEPEPADASPQQAAGTWYYCDASKTYYPYVKQCAGNWRAVPAQPPAN
jgi:hypothetical protein